MMHTQNQPYRQDANSQMYIIYKWGSHLCQMTKERSGHYHICSIFVNICATIQAENVKCSIDSAIEGDNYRHAT